MNTHQRITQPRIFISYAREDQDSVAEIYQKLEKNGFEPWMDIHKILPGEVWENKIQEAIKNSDFFIACLSSNSCQKRGVIQKEIRAALEIWQKKLESDIYLIPIILNKCEVPEKLKGFQWIDLFENEGQNWQRVVEAIKAGWKRLGHASDNELGDINNPLLIENNLIHLEFELEQEYRNFLRVVKEAHTALYRAMIEALRGTANISITGKSMDPNRVVRSKRGNGPWTEMRKQAIPGCNKAWRFSDPKECEEPEMREDIQAERQFDNYLIGFFDALAMIQANAFMGRYVFSKSVQVSDEEMKTLETLHYYKNEFDYFVPKSLLADKSDIPNLLKPCLRIVKELLFKSGNIMPVFIPKNLETLIERVSNKIE